jgi:DNA primase (bacterial type)
MNQVQIIAANLMQDPVPAMGAWKHHNCPACVFKGQPRPDTRGRGNHVFNNDGGIGYNCFNCGIKVNWTPGRYMSSDMKTLLISYGASDKDIAFLELFVEEMVKSGDYEVEESASNKLFQRITKRDFPENTKSFSEWASTPNIEKLHPKFISVLEEINLRNPYLLDLDLYWSPSKEHRMYDRFIIPYYMNGEVIGYTARHKDVDSEYRYVNQVSTSLLYNFDLLNDDRIKVILVGEGPIDAALMGGVSANNYYLTSAQIEMLKAAQQQGKKIVIVPDRDKDGLKAIDQAKEHGFAVSFPDFGTVRQPDGRGIRHIKDLDEACAKYGRLFCVQLIHASIVDDPFMIEVQKSKWI